MPRGWIFWVRDILTAVERIQRYTVEMDFDAFCADEKTIDAVLRNLQIMGEAARHIPSNVEAQWPQIAWKEMRGIRHVVTHEYFSVDLGIVWQTVIHDLPRLIPALTDLLESVD